jgi:hypothetical protein
LCKEHLGASLRDGACALEALDRGWTDEVERGASIRCQADGRARVLELGGSFEDVDIQVWVFGRSVGHGSAGYAAADHGDSNLGHFDVELQVQYVLLQ